MFWQNLKKIKLWKEKPFRIISIIFCLLICFCIVRIALPCKEYSFEGGRYFNSGIPEQAIVYEDISLSPGVYRIELEYSTDTDMQSFCDAADGTVFSGGYFLTGNRFTRDLEKPDMISTFWKTQMGFGYRLFITEPEA